GYHGWTRLQVFPGLFLRYFQNHFLFERNHAHHAVERLRQLRRRVYVQRLIDAGEHSTIQQSLQQILRANIQLLRQLADCNSFRQRHFARRTRFWWSKRYCCRSSATCTGTLPRGMQLSLAFHLALVDHRPLALCWAARIQRFPGFCFRRHFIGKRRKHPWTSRCARTRTRTGRHGSGSLTPRTARSAWSAGTSRTTLALASTGTRRIWPAPLS